MMDERQIRETVVRAGIGLVESGLIVRTWGNISCRLDNNRFAVTPSGRAYETLKPEDIVICNIADGNATNGIYAEVSRTGNIKPSSEKGVHALIYRMKGDAGFVIHTHQRFASAVASSGITAIQDDKMGKIPVAAYSLPGTKKLVRNVEAVLAQANGAILMPHHGALCYGIDYGETFSTALALEDACENFMHKSYMKVGGAQETTIFKIKSSKRDGSGIIVSTADGDTFYPNSASPMPSEAQLHFAIYAARSEINCIKLADGENVVAVSLVGKPLSRLLDDFAQMMGKPMRVAQNRSPAAIVRALGKTGGVLVPGAGALCCAATETDALALCLVTEKNALAEICAAMLGKPKPLSSFDCFLMHLVYTKKYSKQISGG